MIAARPVVPCHDVTQGRNVGSSAKGGAVMGRVKLSPRVHVSPSYRLCLTLLRQPFMRLTRRDWRGAEYLKVNGSLEPGIIVAANHVSYTDPFFLAHFLYDNGRLARFMAKEAVFRLPIAGAIVRGAGQIPVHRGTSDAVRALSSAVQAARDGECVTIYPEGTVTRDPQLWPMTGRTGEVRIALASGAPLIPVAQWGPQEIMRPYRREFRLLPRKTMHVWAGPPLDLDDLRGIEPTTEQLEQATDRLMTAITSLLEEIRGTSAPPVRFVWKPVRSKTDSAGNNGKVAP